MARFRLRRRGRDRLAAWLPVLLVGGLALGSAWLVQNAPKFADEAARRPALHEPDYTMEGFSVRVFDAQGNLQSELTGERGRHYPATDTMDVVEPRMHSLDSSGNPVRGSADRGTSDGDVTDVRLYGNALVVRAPVQAEDGSVLPQMEFRGEYLHALVERELVQSDQRVDLLRGPDVFSGDVFDYDNRSGVANLRGRVRAILQPVDAGVGAPNENRGLRAPVLDQ